VHGVPKKRALKGVKSAALSFVKRSTGSQGRDAGRHLRWRRKSASPSYGRKPPFTVGRFGFKNAGRQRALRRRQQVPDGHFPPRLDRDAVRLRGSRWRARAQHHRSNCPGNRQRDRKVERSCSEPHPGREMESGRSLLASIQRFRGANFDGHRPM
jgi:hypothetical protein